VKRKEEFPLQKVTLNLFDGDMSKLQELYPIIGGSKVIRLLVRAHIKAIEARTENLPKEVISTGLEILEQ